MEPKGQREEFARYYFTQYRRHLQSSATAGLIVYCLFGALDYLLYPRHFELLALLRYGVVTPMVAGCIVYLYRGRSPWLAQALYGLALAAGGSEIGSVVVISGDPHQLYYTGFILALVFTYAISGLRLPYALASGLSMSLFFCTLLALHPVVAREVLINDIFGVAATNMAGAAAGFLLECHRWREFLYRRELERERNGLAEDNRRLSFLSHHDGLTTLSNRRAFDRHLEEEWRRARRQGYPLALLMVDIDDFKAYNDTAGHVAGDQALRMVAGVLASSVSRPGDMAARYGGEEFAVLLVGAALEGALKKGEEVAAAVRGLAIPHPAFEGRVLTVSVGCAAMVPGEEDQVVELIKAADQALYRAKEAGKDRASP